jgi:hypothetical protein
MAPMKEVPLTKGTVAFVDDEDYEWAMQWKWHCTFYGYAQRRDHKTCIWMHLEIAKRAGVEIPFRIDHRNLNSLDNRRQNLRPATQSQNMANRSAPKHNTSGLKGAYWRKDYQRWGAKIQVNYHQKSLGLFDTKEQAHAAYLAAAQQAWGEFAHA